MGVITLIVHFARMIDLWLLHGYLCHHLAHGTRFGSWACTPGRFS